MQTENKNQFTAIHRMLHWLVAILMSALFITGFLRMYWMSKTHIISIIQSETQNIVLSKEQMVGIAKAIREPMWQWHEYAAYIVFFLFLVRMIYMVVKGIKFPNPFVKNQSAKERSQGFMYLLFYLFIGISIITGFYLKWIDGIWKEQMETIHKWAIYWFPIFIVFHFIGILLAELTNKKGIVSRIIGGDK